jgi:hypothetical protein
MWPPLRPFAFTPVPLQSELPCRLRFSPFLAKCIKKIRGLELGQAKSHGYNERLSRINLYAPAHNKPFPFKSSQKVNLLR